MKKSGKDCVGSSPIDSLIVKEQQPGEPRLSRRTSQRQCWSWGCLGRAGDVVMLFAIFISFMLFLRDSPPLTWLKITLDTLNPPWFEICIFKAKARSWVWVTSPSDIERINENCESRGAWNLWLVIRGGRLLIGGVSKWKSFQSRWRRPLQMKQLDS